MSTCSKFSNVEKIQERITLFDRDDAVKIIGICGFAGAGKTSICKVLIQEHPERAFRLNCDLFSALSLADRRIKINEAQLSSDTSLLQVEENPKNWYNWEGIFSAIESLRQHRKFLFDRAWNYKTGQLDGQFELSLPTDGPVLVLCDCIFLQHNPVRTWLDQTVLVECPDRLLAIRRSGRAKNAQAEQSARLRQERFERPYFETYGNHADIRLTARLAE